MTIDAMIKEIKENGFVPFVASLDSSTIKLMNEAVDVFERYREIDQMLVLAIMFGTLCASIEGEPCEWEAKNLSFLTYYDRMRIFQVLASVVYDAAMEKRKDPNCPQPRRM